MQVISEIDQMLQLLKFPFLGFSDEFFACRLKDYDKNHQA